MIHNVAFMVRPDGCVGGAGDMYVHIIEMRSMLYFRASQKKDVSFFGDG